MSLQAFAASRSLEDMLVAVQRVFINFIITFILLVGFVVVLLDALTPGEDGGLILQEIVPLSLIIVGGVVLLFLNRQGNTLLVSRALMYGLTAATLVSLFAEIEVLSAYYEALALLTLLTIAVLASPREYLILNTLIFVGLVVHILVDMRILQLSFLPHEISEFEEGHTNSNIISALSFLALSISVRYFLNTMQGTLEQSRRSAELLQGSADVAQVTTRLLDLRELLTEAIERIRSRFNFYHVQVFLVNEQLDQAELVASTGDVGQKLLARGHRLAIGSQSVIGQVTLRGEPVIARLSDSKAVHARNELLMNTKSELALPILDGEEIIGALDVQSTDEHAFNDEDKRALQIIANLLATAIRNARLFEAQGRVLEDNARLLHDAQESLREIERLNQQLTGKSWQTYLDDDKSIQGVTMTGNQTEPASLWSPELMRAGAQNRPTISEDGHSVVAVPIVLRGEVIGAMEVSPEEGASTEETIEMMQAVAQRLAISLDNARLFEESQEAAANEVRINDIVSKYQAANSIDELLRITLNELGDTLGAQRGAIRLGEAPNMSVNGENGHV